MDAERRTWSSKEKKKKEKKKKKKKKKKIEWIELRKRFYIFADAFTIVTVLRDVERVLIRYAFSYRRASLREKKTTTLYAYL